MNKKQKILTTALLSGTLLFAGCTNSNPIDDEVDDSTDVVEVATDDTKDDTKEVSNHFEPEEYFEIHPDIDEMYHEKMDALTNTEASDFEMISTDGETYHFDDLKGEDTLIAFVASWCEPCNQMLPILSEFNEKEDNPEVIIVAAFDTAEDFKDLGVVTDSLGLDLYQTGEFEADDYMLNSVPQFTYVDKQGDIKIISGGQENIETLELYAKTSFNK